MSLQAATNPTLRLNTGTDLSSATSPEIHYKKPDGSTGEWPGTINGQYIEYTFGGADLDQAGTWEVQAVATFGSNIVKGDPTSVSVTNPIKTT